MANGRGSIKGNSGRDPGKFIALPASVTDCPAYINLGYPAKALLIDIARQFTRDNNGRLLCSMAHLQKRGWTSSSVVNRAKRELLDAGFLYETVKGCRPNKASWYAITWQTLDKHIGYDAGAERGFKRSAYMQSVPLKNALLSSVKKAQTHPIASPKELEKDITNSDADAVMALLPPPPSSDAEHHLDKPSARDAINW